MRQGPRHRSTLRGRARKRTGVRCGRLIAGGGPTGLMLAGELALAGVDVAIVERRRRQSWWARGRAGSTARTIEILDQRGIAERFLAEGRIAQVAGFAGPCSTSATSRRGTRTRSRSARTTSSGSCSAGSTSWGSRSIAGRGDRLRAGRRRRRRHSWPSGTRCARSTWSAADGGRSVVRRAGRHRLPRLRTRPGAT